MASKTKLLPQVENGGDLGLKAGIWASSLGFGPQGWDLGLEAGIWALMLGFGP